MPETETSREDFPVGNETNREPEIDQTGMYPAVLHNLQRVAKTAEDIDREAKMFGKDPDKLDKAQYFWDFTVEGFRETLRVYSGTYFGEKAKATDVAAALLGRRPNKGETISASQFWDKGCQVLVEFDQEKGRNKITKLMPTKRAAAPQVTVAKAQTPAYGPHAFNSNMITGKCEDCGEGKGSLIHAAVKPSPQAPLMAGASDPDLSDDYWSQVADEADR